MFHRNCNPQRDLTLESKSSRRYEGEGCVSSSGVRCKIDIGGTRRDDTVMDVEERLAEGKADFREKIDRR